MAQLSVRQPKKFSVHKMDYWIDVLYQKDTMRQKNNVIQIFVKKKERSFLDSPLDSNEIYHNIGANELYVDFLQPFNKIY